MWPGSFLVCSLKIIYLITKHFTWGYSSRLGFSVFLSQPGGSLWFLDVGSSRCEHAGQTGRKRCPNQRERLKWLLYAARALGDVWGKRSESSVPGKAGVEGGAGVSVDPGSPLACGCSCLSPQTRLWAAVPNPPSSPLLFPGRPFSFPPPHRATPGDTGPAPRSFASASFCMDLPPPAAGSHAGTGTAALCEPPFWTRGQRGNGALTGVGTRVASNSLLGWSLYNSPKC